MKWKWEIALLWCLAIFHTPDGIEILLDTHHISAIRPAEYAKGHVVAGVNAIISIGSQNYGVSETPSQAQDLLRHCVEEQD
jgi:hypothetical protein